MEGYSDWWGYVGVDDVDSGIKVRVNVIGEDLLEVDDVEVVIKSVPEWMGWSLLPTGRRFFGFDLGGE